MSEQHVSAFLDRLTTDHEYRGHVGEALQGRADTAAATVEIAREAGFEFTPDEFDRAVTERYAGRELSDAELEGATGGALTVGVNRRSVSYKTTTGATIAFPDVCKTPAPGAPVPVPYPNGG